jgi:hypothetical protein
MLAIVEHEQQLLRTERLRNVPGRHRACGEREAEPGRDGDRDQGQILRLKSELLLAGNAPNIDEAEASFFEGHRRCASSERKDMGVARSDKSGSPLARYRSAG